MTTPPSTAASLAEGDEAAKVDLRKADVQPSPGLGAASATDAPPSRSRRLRRADRTERAPRPHRGLRRLIAGLAVLAVLLAAVLVTQLIKGTGRSGKLAALQTQREQARVAAENLAPRIFTYNYKDLAADEAATRAATTGPFSQQALSLIGPAVKPLAMKYHVVVNSVAVGSAVQDDSDPKNIRVLVFLDQQVTNDLLAAPRLDQQRLLVSMVPVAGDWKVAGVAAL